MKLKTGTSETLDRVIHERARLAIVSALAAEKEMSFPELKVATGLTDGNLSVQLKTLEIAGYVALRKSEEGGRKSRTAARLTGGGRRAFTAYLAALDRVLGKWRK
jgi:DNA-binding transcriptional ArsR family regulator